MRKEIEKFDDGKQTVRSYDADGRLFCIESFAATGQLSAAIDYLYNDTGINHERIVRDSAGTVLRRIQLDDEGKELNADDAGPVRWASLDGTDDGVDPKGQEQLDQ
ncbi:MAG: hypothetical protein ACR2P6_04000 [Gammaproteobacteria bacterium]